MANYISENDIEKACCEVIMNELKYDEHFNLWQLPNDGNEVFGRNNASEVVRLETLRNALIKINPKISKNSIGAAILELTQNRLHLTMFEANRAITKLLHDGFNVPFINTDGVADFERVRFIDYEKPENNHFCLVQQLTIRGKGTRRPDLIIFINGLPMVFIELKNATEPTRQAYDKNLTDYRKDIAHLFHYNLVVVLSNSFETKVGSHTADWEQFFNWEKIADEKEEPVAEKEIDLLQVMRALFRKETLIDLLENFVLFYADRAKIVGKNHQFLGVNNVLKSFRSREDRNGKLGVFWHTQGSGKSFSMAFLTNKIRRKESGNFKFVLITDRDDLEDQLHKTFVRSNIIGENESVLARSSKDLEERIKNSSSYVFTLIQKFKSKGQGIEFKKWTDNENIIGIVDEAHRSQYRSLGENMRKAMPNANYIAFTGTPLLDAVETTKEWFGDYVSRYDFSDSIADGSTVPLFYQNRVPQVQLQNDTLNDEYAEIIEDEDLTDEQQEKLTRDFANITTVITDNDRLESIAQDIVKHFPERGYLGKGMVISIDKATALKMHDKVKRLWDLRIKELRGQMNALPTGSPEKLEIERKRNWMRETEMCVIVSYEGEEETKFDKLGLNIRPHRAMMNRTWGENHETIEDRFRNENTNLRLVFVCAKWLTGFDAQTVSTLYLDKPMQNHTLMQTIARANRVAPALDKTGKVATPETTERVEKKNGVVIDYIGVFARLEKALSKYAKPQGNNQQHPVEEFEKLLDYLETSIIAGVDFMNNQGLPIEEIINSSETFANLSQFKVFADKISKTEELKKEISVYQTAITSFYEACKPDIFTEEILRESKYQGKYKRCKETFEYLRKIITRQKDNEGNFENAKNQAEVLIDESIISSGYSINSLQEINLSHIDFDRLQRRFKASPYKNLSLSDMKDFLEERIKQLLCRNVTRVDLAHKLREIISNYNSTSSDVEAFFKALKEYAEKLREEERRAASEGLTEAELELFDLLFKDNLSASDKKKVKEAAKLLLKKLEDNEIKKKVLVTDWYKNEQLRQSVNKMIGDVLNETLPDSYDKKVFLRKQGKIYSHVYNTALKGREYWV